MLKIALESLGCSKNLVDAEIMMGILNKKGYKLVGDFEDADITMRAKQKGKAWYVPSANVVHLWHRETATSCRRFMTQVKSMFIYFKKWGFKLF